MKKTQVSMSGKKKMTVAEFMGTYCVKRDGASIDEEVLYDLYKSVVRNPVHPVELSYHLSENGGWMVGRRWHGIDFAPITHSPTGGKDATEKLQRPRERVAEAFEKSGLENDANGYHLAADIYHVDSTLPIVRGYDAVLTWEGEEKEEKEEEAETSSADSEDTTDTHCFVDILRAVADLEEKEGNMLTEKEAFNQFVKASNELGESSADSDDFLDGYDVVDVPQEIIDILDNKNAFTDGYEAGSAYTLATVAAVVEAMTSDDDKNALPIMVKFDDRRADEVNKMSKVFIAMLNEISGVEAEIVRPRVEGGL